MMSVFLLLMLIIALGTQIFKNKCSFRIEFLAILNKLQFRAGQKNKTILIPIYAPPTSVCCFRKMYVCGRIIYFRSCCTKRCKIYFSVELLQTVGSNIISRDLQVWLPNDKELSVLVEFCNECCNQR